MIGLKPYSTENCCFTLLQKLKTGINAMNYPRNDSQEQIE